MTQGSAGGGRHATWTPRRSTRARPSAPPWADLTVTIGYGPSLFDERFGLAAKKPALLVDLPALPNENLDPDYVGGDLCIQACSDDPLVAFHAVRNLARLGMGVVELQLDGARVRPDVRRPAPAEATPRNLLGFKDGTRNIKAQQTDLLGRLRLGRQRDATSPG